MSGHINLGRGWGCSLLGSYYYFIKFIYILITSDQVMLVQLAANIFVLVALKLFLIHYCIIF